MRGGRYQVLDTLGQGGMGTVFKVRHQQLDTVLALKELTLHGAHAAEQFRLEAQILARLAHPGLPRVTDFFSRQGRYYLVMDFIEGEDLQTLLQRSQHPFSERDVMHWMGQLLDILAYIHRQGVVHRDIKPANLKLTPQGRICLVDFGLAKQCQASHTLFGAQGFTPYFAAPEQIQGHPTDTRTDLYAAGVCAAYLLTQQLPPPLAVCQANPQVSPTTERWVQQAMATLAANRFQSAEAMRQELETATPISTDNTPPLGFRRDLRKR